VNLGSEEFEELVNEKLVNGKLVNGKLVNAELGSDIHQRAGQRAILFQKYVNLEVGLINAVGLINVIHSIIFTYRL